ncbi:MAG: hypothetical protein EOP83_28630 [Verrucomicrobiaceae bacterium]|nr:MAG: hypothetical protein EOP83_28630 [Verrucomicrobiaceae bacterium]
MIEFDENLKYEVIELYPVEIIRPESFVRGSIAMASRTGQGEGRTMKIIKEILADQDDQWVGRFCVGESLPCDEHGGDELKPSHLGVYPCRKDTFLFDDANTAFAVRMKFT